MVNVTSSEYALDSADSVWRVATELMGKFARPPEEWQPTPWDDPDGRGPIEKPFVMRVGVVPAAPAGKEEAAGAPTPRIRDFKLVDGTVRLNRQVDEKRWQYSLTGCTTAKCLGEPLRIANRSPSLK